MYFLEYLEYQGENKCPRYRWKQWLRHEDKAYMEKIRQAQSDPTQFRVEPDAVDYVREQEEQAQRKKGDNNGIES